MKFILTSQPTTVFAVTGFVTVGGARCVKGEAVMRRLNRKHTGYRNIAVETTARIEDVEMVADVTLAVAYEAA